MFIRKGRENDKRNYLKRLQAIIFLWLLDNAEAWKAFTLAISYIYDTSSSQRETKTKQNALEDICAIESIWGLQPRLWFLPQPLSSPPPRRSLQWGNGSPKEEEMTPQDSEKKSSHSQTTGWLAFPTFQSSGVWYVFFRNIPDQEDKCIPTSEKGRELRSSTFSDLHTGNSYSTVWSPVPCGPQLPRATQDLLSFALCQRTL